MALVCIEWMGQGLNSSLLLMFRVTPGESKVCSMHAATFCSQYLNIVLHKITNSVSNVFVWCDWRHGRADMVCLQTGWPFRKSWRCLYDQVEFVSREYSNFKQHNKIKYCINSCQSACIKMNKLCNSAACLLNYCLVVQLFQQNHNPQMTKQSLEVLGCFKGEHESGSGDPQIWVSGWHRSLQIWVAHQ